MHEIIFLLFFYSNNRSEKRESGHKRLQNWKRFDYISDATWADTYPGLSLGGRGRLSFLGIVQNLHKLFVLYVPVHKCSYVKKKKKQFVLVNNKFIKQLLFSIKLKRYALFHFNEPLNDEY